MGKLKFIEGELSCSTDNVLKLEIVGLLTITILTDHSHDVDFITAGNYLKNQFHILILLIVLVHIQLNSLTIIWMT